MTAIDATFCSSCLYCSLVTSATLACAGGYGLPAHLNATTRLLQVNATAKPARPPPTWAQHRSSGNCRSQPGTSGVTRRSDTCDCCDGAMCPIYGAHQFEPTQVSDERLTVRMRQPQPGSSRCARFSGPSARPAKRPSSYRISAAASPAASRGRDRVPLPFRPRLLDARSRHPEADSSTRSCPTPAAAGATPTACGVAHGDRAPRTTAAAVAARRWPMLAESRMSDKAPARRTGNGGTRSKAPAGARRMSSPRREARSFQPWLTNPQSVARWYSTKPSPSRSP